MRLNLAAIGQRAKAAGVTDGGELEALQMILDVDVPRLIARVRELEAFVREVGEYENDTIMAMNAQALLREGER